MNPYIADFPILKKMPGKKRLVYIDNGATTQKPRSVIQAECDYYTMYNANIHRGMYTLSQRATDACDATREKMRKLLNARESGEIIFTSGTTMSINLLTYTWAEKFLKKGDGVLLTMMEHHANVVPWQELAKRKNIKISYVPLQKTGELNYATLSRLVTRKTKLVSVAHISNVLGVENDIAKIESIVRKRSKAKLIIDAAQSIAHVPIDVQKLNIDFLVASGHKMYGPTGIGILYGKKELLEQMPPFLTGGDMIIDVSTERTIFQGPPARFEAGTPNIAGIIGLGAAADFLMDHGITKLAKAEKEITEYAYEKLSEIKDVTMYGPKERHGIISFNVEGVHAHDVAEICNRFGVCIRSGNHCAMPLHRFLKIPASARASFACYNTKADVDELVLALKEAKKIFT